MLKTCESCGKTFDLLTWETKCYSCRKEEYHKQLKEDILSGEEDRTYSENTIICPWCGEDQGIEDDYQLLYEDGYHHDNECCNCGKKFTVITDVSYSYSTEREE